MDWVPLGKASKIMIIQRKAVTKRSAHSVVGVTVLYRKVCHEHQHWRNVCKNNHTVCSTHFKHSKR